MAEAQLLDVAKIVKDNNEKNAASCLNLVDTSLKGKDVWIAKAFARFCGREIMTHMVV